MTKFVISANNVKLFAKAIHCLARLGNEIYLDCPDGALEVKTVNPSRSAFACFTFPCTFFRKFDSPADGDNKLPSCKIPVKTFLQVFRSLGFIERSVETCDLSLSEDCCQLIFTLNCKHAIIKTYRLNFEECENLKAVFRKDMCPNKLTAPCKLLQDVLVNFPSSLDEISLMVSPCKVTLSSYADRAEGVKVMSTLMNLNPEEFTNFQIGVDTNVSFCLKDLRAILGFPESCDAECKMDFECGGKPLVLGLVEDDVFEANFVLATISGNDESSSVNIELCDATNHVGGKSRSSNTRTEKQPKTTVNQRRRHPDNRHSSKTVAVPGGPCTQDSFEIPDQSHHPLPDPENCDMLSHANVRDLFFYTPGNSMHDTGQGILAADSDDEM